MSRAGDPMLDDRELRQVSDFLIEEAEILDDGRYVDWLALLTSDVRYRVYAPVVRMTGAPIARVPLFEEDMTALRSRVVQLSNPELTVAENPRSVDRRFVTNVRAKAGSGGEIEVRSNLLVRRTRGLGQEPQFFSATRTDILRSSADGLLRLAVRLAQLDDAVVLARSVSLFL